MQFPLLVSSSIAVCVLCHNGSSWTPKWKIWIWFTCITSTTNNTRSNLIPPCCWVTTYCLSFHTIGTFPQDIYSKMVINRPVWHLLHRLSESWSWSWVEPHIVPKELRNHATDCMTLFPSFQIHSWSWYTLLTLHQWWSTPSLQVIVVNLLHAPCFFPMYPMTTLFDFKQIFFPFSCPK